MLQLASVEGQAWHFCHAKVQMLEQELPSFKSIQTLCELFPVHNYLPHRVPPIEESKMR